MKMSAPPVKFLAPPLPAARTNEKYPPSFRLGPPLSGAGRWDAGVRLHQRAVQRARLPPGGRTRHRRRHSESPRRPACVLGAGRALRLFPARPAQRPAHRAQQHVRATGHLRPAQRPLRAAAAAPAAVVRWPPDRRHHDHGRRGRDCGRTRPDRRHRAGAGGDPAGRCRRPRSSSTPTPAWRASRCSRFRCSRRAPSITRAPRGPGIASCARRPAP